MRSNRKWDSLRAATLLRDHPPPVLRADATRLPVRDRAVDAVTDVLVAFRERLLDLKKDPRYAARGAPVGRKPSGRKTSSKR